MFRENLPRSYLHAHDMQLVIWPLLADNHFTLLSGWKMQLKTYSIHSFNNFLLSPSKTHPWEKRTLLRKLLSVLWYFMKKRSAKVWIYPLTVTSKVIFIERATSKIILKFVIISRKDFWVLCEWWKNSLSQLL